MNINTNECKQKQNKNNIVNNITNYKKVYYYYDISFKNKQWIYEPK